MDGTINKTRSPYVENLIIIAFSDRRFRGLDRQDYAVH